MKPGTAYRFAQGILRDAAYQLHLPGQRSRLHALALLAIEKVSGGRPPALPSPGSRRQRPFRPHPSDGMLSEMIEHARLAERGCTHAESLRFRRIRRNCLHRGALAAEAGGRSQESSRFWDELGPLLDLPGRGEAQRRSGLALAGAGKPAAGIALIRDAIRTQKRAENPGLEGRALASMAVLLMQTGEIARAEEHFREALGIHLLVHDAAARLTTLGNLSTLLIQTGRVAEAKDLLHEVVVLGRRSRNLRAVGLACTNLGNICGAAGEAAEAEAKYNEAIRLLSSTGDRNGRAVALGNYANLLLLQGRMGEAEARLQEVLRVHTESGNVRLEGVTLGHLANLHRKLGRLQEAERLFHKALSIHAEVSDIRSRGRTLGNLALLLDGENRSREAMQHVSSALECLQQAGDRRLFVAFLGARALIHLGIGNLPAARRDWRESERLLLAAGGPGHDSEFVSRMHERCRVLGLRALDEPARRAAEGPPPHRPGESKPRA